MSFPLTWVAPFAGFLPRTGLIGATILLALVGCAEEKPEARILRLVRTQEVHVAREGRVRTFTGSAQAGLESRLSFRVAGSVQRIAVKVGDVVEKGQLLAELDPIDYQLQVDDAQAALARARAEQRKAEADLDRVRGLYENNNASQNELDASRTTYESAVASVASAEKRLELAQNQLSYTRLKSPVRGAIADVPREVNENVSAGQTVILMASGSRAEVQVAIPEALISRIRQGQAVEVTFDAIPGRVFDAAVTEVGIATVGLATTYPVTVRLEDVSQDIRPGMAAEVSFHFEDPEGRDRLLVPPHAVVEDGQGRFVYVVEAREGELGVIRRRPVRVGELVNEGMEILEGLEDGERVVIAGISRIQDGLEVKITDHQGTPP